MTDKEKKEVEEVEEVDITEPRIGVYVCHCGTNIGGVIDCPELAKYAATLPNVVEAKDYKFMCSDPGQLLIKEGIEEKKLNRIIVAACSPRMHEPTFRVVCSEAGLNPFLFEQANIREHNTWVHMREPEKATQIAKDLLRMAVAKASNLDPLDVKKVSVKPTCLIIGGGIGGISAALDLAEAGYKTYLVEKLPSIGGRMSQLDKTFPTMDCSACILTPKMVDSSRHPNIELLTYTELLDISGYVGNFKVKLLKKPRYVDAEKCTSCGDCAVHCPIIAPNEFELGMAPKRAIYVPFPQAVPLTYTIDKKYCIECGICKKVCAPEAIDYDMQPEEIELEVGTIIITTGYDPYDPTTLEQYGWGIYENVITGMQMERLLSSFGPTSGKVKRPSDLKEPHKVLFIQCVGSRNLQEGSNPYCSRVCCMYSSKHARQYKEKHPEAEIFVSYMDIRAFGKGYEEFYEIVQREYGVNYIRGRIAEIREVPETKNLIVRGEDTVIGQPFELEVDLVVLAVGLVPRKDMGDLVSILHLQQSADGFLLEAHPKLRPVDTLTSGIFIAGVAQGPKDIPDTVAQAKGAAASAIALMGKGEVEIEPYFAIVNEALCSGCRTCVELCPFTAISMVEKDGRLVAEVNEALCKGCGTCVAACPSTAIIQNHFRDKQIFKQIIAATQELKEV
ncbi:MAG: 4Fe-4S binding protein [Candidatus Helarchaeota archaeon]